MQRHTPWNWTFKQIKQSAGTSLQSIQYLSQYFEHNVETFWTYFFPGAKASDFFRDFTEKFRHAAGVFYVKSRNSQQSVWCKGTHRGIEHLNRLNRFKQVLTNASRFWRNAIKVFEHVQRGCKGIRFFPGFHRKKAAACRIFPVKSRKKSDAFAPTLKMFKHFDWNLFESVV